MEEEIKPVKKRPIALIVVLGLAGVVALGGIMYTQTRSSFIDYNYTLYMSAKALNIGLPREVGDGVRLDSVAAKYDKELWYYYTMTGITKDENFEEQQCEDYQSNLEEALSGDESLKEFGRNGVTMIYQFGDKKGLPLCNIRITSDRYYKSESE